MPSLIKIINVKEKQHYQFYEEVKERAAYNPEDDVLSKNFSEFARARSLLISLHMRGFAKAVSTQKLSLQ